jgi:hypothetical protein
VDQASIRENVYFHSRFYDQDPSAAQGDRSSRPLGLRRIQRDAPTKFGAQTGDAYG